MRWAEKFVLPTIIQIVNLNHFYHTTNTHNCNDLYWFRSEVQMQNKSFFFCYVLAFTRSEENYEPKINKLQELSLIDRGGRWKKKGFTYLITMVASNKCTRAYIRCISSFSLAKHQPAVVVVILFFFAIRRTIFAFTKECVRFFEILILLYIVCSGFELNQSLIFTCNDSFFLSFILSHVVQNSHTPGNPNVLFVVLTLLKIAGDDFLYCILLCWFFSVSFFRCLLCNHNVMCKSRVHSYHWCT